ncbi:RnfABCDGE type electron transport complex subunit D [Aureimonas populi]|uniref:RnfABCDGE type electron transport complex subunit D n=1 Tax=Aureimonas populi TaxID=1701758 RepID=A0ABW5CME2_9HYPH|nr:RnfABCDGE type electron transport complex subunit D [Aureimonas populi]
MIAPAIPPLAALRHRAMAGGGTPLALAALAVPLFAAGLMEGWTLPARLALVLLVTLGWQVAFAGIRKRGLEPSGIVTAALIALLVPAEAPYWQLILATTFGVVIGGEVFGGRGRGFVHPAVVALTFLMFSFASPDYRQDPGIPALAVAPAAILLLLGGQASWRILLAAVAVLAAVVSLREAGDPLAILSSGSVLVALLFLCADPVASASTNAGRWAYGALAGLLAGLFAQAGPAFGSVVFAVLMASIFAPALDQIAIALHMRWREKRHG